MKIVFFGSSKYSVIDEKALFEAFGLSLVVTTRQFATNPVEKFAKEKNIPVITVEKLTDEIFSEIAKYQSDFLVTADIRLILPKKLLKLPKIAAINVHHSLLPKYRGPAPVPFAILNGEKETGVSIILIAEKVDTGDILAKAKYEFKKDDTTDSVLTKLNELGGRLAVEVIQNFDKYYKSRKVQNEKDATYSHYMIRDLGFVDIATPPDPEKLDLMIRAYYPWPGAFTLANINNKETRIKLLLNKMLQVEGKKPMGYKDFINGYPEGREILKQLQLL